MLEFLICSMLTIFPDFLFRRFVQGKRVGREINLYSMWFELRWGITACVLLTLSLITLVFYFHPSTTTVTSIFRTVTILPEMGGRVAEVYVSTNDSVKAGQPLFRLDDSEQRADLETASRRVAEIDAEMTVARSELAGADAAIEQARSAYRQALDELSTKQELMNRGSNTVSAREIERLQNAVDGRQAGIDATLAAKQTVEIRIATLLPAQKASAEASLREAEVELAKTLVTAGIDGTVQQFALRPGDVVNPMLRPAGILVPARAGKVALIAGFGQIEAQVLKPGMIGEVTCIAKPFVIIPMVVTEVQAVIASGQLRPTDQLVDVQNLARPGTLTAFMEPLYPNGLDGIPPGSNCIANAYTSNHDRLASPDVGALERFWLHMIDTVGLVHAMILRLQALLLPVQTLVLGGH
jgi:multidrug resistance efflux pump